MQEMQPSASFSHNKKVIRQVMLDKLACQTSQAMENQTSLKIKHFVSGLPGASLHMQYISK